MQSVGLTSRPSGTVKGGGLLQWRSNEQIAQDQRNEIENQASLANDALPMTSLGSHIRTAFRAAIDAKRIVTERLLKCRRQRDGVYDADKLVLISQSRGTKIYMMLTDIKCQALESWLKDIMLPVGERPYKLEPTPIPELPEDVQQAAYQELFMQFAQETAEANGGQFDPRMIDPIQFEEAMKELQEELKLKLKEMADKDAGEIEDVIEDEFKEGTWYQALSEFIEDFATYPTAFLAGPIYRKRKRLEWQPIRNTKLHSLRVVDKIVKEYNRLSPFDVFPSPGSVKLSDGDLCIRERFSRRDLQSMIGVPGFNEVAIKSIISRYGEKGYRENIYSDLEMSDLHDRPNEQSDPEGHIEAIKFYGAVTGWKLTEWGMPDIKDAMAEYEIVAFMAGDTVFSARLNSHPLNHRNIYSASFRNKNGSIWGKGVPEVMEDTQDICNSTGRAICNNMAIGSGPQVWTIEDRFPPGEQVTSIVPFKIWRFTSSQMGSGSDLPMGFFQPRIITDQLIKVYDYYFKQASEVTGIPGYIYGNEGVTGAGKTASGLSMLMNAASKGIKNAAKNIDSGVITPSVFEHWLSIVLTNPKMAKGDVNVVPRASDYLIQQEQLSMRRTEYLGATNNQADLDIMGLEGRAELHRETVRSLKMPVDRIIPKRGELHRQAIQKEIEAVLMQLAQQLGVAPEVLMQLLQAPAPKQVGGQPQRQIAGPEGG